MPFRPLWLLVFLTAALVTCDQGLEPEPICAPGFIGVCGTVRVEGTIPDSTDDVFGVAFVTFPVTCEDVILNRQPLFPGTIPYTDSVGAYSIPLLSGPYEWVLAVWKKDGQPTGTVADTALLRVAGYYRNPADTSLPGAVTVPIGGAAGGIDFLVDFDNLRPATDFVTCTAQ